MHAAMAMQSQAPQGGRPGLDAVTEAALGPPQHDPVRGGIGGVAGIGTGLGGIHNTSAVAVGQGQGQGQGAQGLPGGVIGNGSSLQQPQVSMATVMAAGAGAMGPSAMGPSVMGPGPGYGPYGTGAMTTAGPGGPAPGAAPPAAADVLRSSFAEPMGNILRFMDAVQATPAANPQSFREVWANIGSPQTVTGMAKALQRDMVIPPAHIVGILSQTGQPYREYLHSQILDLSERMKGEMPEFIQAVMMVHWLTSVVLPALQAAGLPEDSALGTSAALRKNYASITEACTIARPDGSNPTCIQLQQQAQKARAALEDAERRRLEAAQVAEAHQARLQALGFALVADELADKARVKHLAKSQLSLLTALTITGFVLFGLVLIVMIVLLVLQNKKGAVGQTGATSGMGSGSGLGAGSGSSFPSLGGVPSGPPAVMPTAPNPHAFFTTSGNPFELSSQWR